MSATNPTASCEGNAPIEERAFESCDTRGYFREHTYESFELSHVICQEEEPIYDYMLKRQCNPETLDEICRKTGVDMGYVLQWLENMVAKNFVDRQVTSGVSRYVLTEIGKTVEDTSAFFNDLNGNTTNGRVDSTEDSTGSAEELEQHLEEGCWVLVLGCDCGEFIAGLAKKFPHTSFIAVHSNRKSLVNIMETCLQSEVYNVNFQEEDPDMLPNSWIQCFDWVILYDVINGVPDMKQTLKNTRRVLKKTGVLSLTFKPKQTHDVKDVDITNENTDITNENTAGGKQNTDVSYSNTNRNTQSDASCCKKEDYSVDFVRKMLAETMFEIIRLDEMISSEQRVHIMCSVNDNM